MRATRVLTVACASLALGVCIGLSAKDKLPGFEILQGKPPKEAGVAALQEAEKLAGNGSWELIAIARVYYLSGDHAKAQSLIDRALSHKPKATDFQRVGEIFAAAGDSAQGQQSAFGGNSLSSGDSPPPGGGPSRTPQPAGAGVSVQAGSVYRISLDVKLAGGYESHARAVVALAGDPNSNLVRVLDWGTALPPGP